ncbi:Molybdenum cofactor sulfurase [Lachnellula hyalina]|uniref:Molybdenum cofactor sulfurase n=1 Tax=Lachnellula hyalina TaxID=1316788 RepID=A0A8H8R8F4_9HELO|nr:Molybdenum cofactor sulfurase [Lachnellula hyalina]TVY30265.1 Molybdenum cofactor sulfurase [Lachnellula hyalina]
MSPTDSFYNEDIDTIRQREYPMLKEATYLDHSGTTLYAKSLVESFATSMIDGLYGNPHSGSASSILSTKNIDNVRLRVLQFVKADPEEFDVVFTANATAAIKIVTEGFRSRDKGFSYLYHRDAHTSLIGVRESASRGHCFTSDEAVEHWIESGDEAREESGEMPTLFAYPAQSNMNGRRLPLTWPGQVRKTKSNTYTLLDVAAFVSSAKLDLSNLDEAPDFLSMSFYKIFGFPDLGALIVRKPAGHMLSQRKYFGGGTVDLVTCLKEQCYIPKKETIHQQLEDGTLPIHNILALNSAFDVHTRLYGSMDQISKHTSTLARNLYQGLSTLKHFNGQPVCIIYTDSPSSYGGKEQGPTVALNIKDSNGQWVDNSEIEKIASIRNIHLRIGGVCNSGGIAHYLDISPSEMRENLALGQRCGINSLGVGGKPTGIIRVSLGAMSNMTDVTTFIDFVSQFFVEEESQQVDDLDSEKVETPSLFVESLTVYPIKSCSGWPVPANTPWEIKKEGLSFDREWCLVHSGTGRILSQKRYPRMALLKPEIDLKQGMLRVRVKGEKSEEAPEQVSVPLDFRSADFKTPPSNSSGTAANITPYNSPQISDFFTSALGVPCNLARFPASAAGPSTRHSKPHLQKTQVPRKRPMEESIAPATVQTPFPTPPQSPTSSTSQSLLFSNESPILCTTRPSLDALNSELLARGKPPIHYSVFRSNIVIASSLTPTPAYLEDSWTHLEIGDSATPALFQMLGKCQRCSMVCVNQETGAKSEEPFVTLAKTRRFDNKVYFGEHMSLMWGSRDRVFVKIGDVVKASTC